MDRHLQTGETLSSLGRTHPFHSQTGVSHRAPATWVTIRVAHSMSRASQCTGHSQSFVQVPYSFLRDGDEGA